MLEPFVKSLPISRWLSCVANRPVSILILILTLTVLIGAKVPWLIFSASMRELIVDDVPERQCYDEFKALFGTDEIIQVVVKGEDIFSPPFFTQLRNLSKTLSEVPGVSRIISLPQVKAAVDPQDQWSLQRFANLTVPVSIFQRYLISPDHRVSSITLILDDHADQEAISQTVNTSLAQLGKGYQGYQIGMPPVSIALARYAQQDFLHLPFYTILIIAALLLITFRSIIEMAIPLLTVAVAGVWTMGAMAWSGIALNILTVVVPILQIAVGTAYCLYIYCAFKECVHVCIDTRSALEKTYSRTAYPTLIAVCTTIAGIISLMVTPIGAVRQFSGFACLGILALLVAVSTFLPCLLVLAWPSLRNRASPTKEKLFSPARVDRLISLIERRQWYVFWALAIFALIMIAGIFRIRIETNPLSYFRDSTPINRQFHDIYDHLSGSFPLHLMISSNEEDHFLSINAIKTLTAHQRFLETLPGVDKTLSVADYLMMVNYVTNRFEPTDYALPEADYEIRMLVNQFKSLLGRDILKRYVNETFTIANIAMFTRLSSSRGFMNTEKLIRNYCAQHRDEKIICHTTGFGMVMSHGSRHLQSGQMWSLLITLGIIFIIIYLMFFSIKIGVIALVTNLFPIMVSFGAMGWLGIDLSMGTCLIASIVLGLAVDDTIHFLTRYKLAYAQEMDSAAAMRRTMAHIGQPIVATSLAISAGFSILMLSSFTPTAVFGLLMMLAMASALIGGLIILPTLLSKVSPITLEEVFQLRIGGEQLPNKVPLLKGMTRFQVHRILNSGEILRVDSGNHLFDQGDVADRMYVVISGVFDAVMTESVENPERREFMPKRVNRLKVGDVIGEMGVMTSGFCCVSVVAIATGEVLALSQKNLARIRRLSPRTASRFFANLSTVLTKKLIKADLSLSRSCSLDDDTGVLNREAFLDCFEKEINRAQRSSDPLAICLLTIDYHDNEQKVSSLEEEEFICQVAQVLSGNLRKIDTMGRFDKSTLAVLMLRTESSYANEICSRLKAAFCNQNMLDGRIKTTISCQFMDLDCQLSHNNMDKVQGPVTTIHSAIQKSDRHLLYASHIVTSKKSMLNSSQLDPKD